MDQLLKIWYPKYLRYSTHQLQSREAAKDVVQETLLTIARKIGRLRDPVTFPKWSYRILHRRGVDYQRKEIKRREKESSGVLTVEVDVSQPGSGFSSAVSDALQELGELSYNVIHLHYLHGLSIKEISTVCGIPAGTVKSRLHSARRSLKTLLAE